jgi:acetyl-CoA acyltransferase 2
MQAAVGIIQPANSALRRANRLAFEKALYYNHLMKDSLVFLAGKRTPFGSYGGRLKDVNPSDLGLSPSVAALKQSGVDPSEIDHVIFGNVLHSAKDSICTPRHIGLKAGIPVPVPALGINRLCGSGFQAIVEAWHQMLAGDTKLALVGGVENMSMSPYVLRNARWGMKMGHGEVADSMVESLYDTYPQASMGTTAENLAEQYKITRSEADDFALRSQELCQKGRAAGAFQEEIAPFIVVDRKGNPQTLDRDEHPRPETTRETLAKLKSTFKKDGTVTAGSASGIVDGAAALIVASEAEATRRGAKPLGRMIAYGIQGCDPRIMGIGPVPAARQALQRAGLKLEQMDLIEVNEAFAPQALAVVKELGIPMDRFNVNGGAIAIGHPLAASGTRIIMHLLYELRRRGKRYGLGSACIGGGQGIAIVVEAL